MNAASGNVVPQTDVAGSVHGHAAHPAIIRVRSKCALLEDIDVAIRITQFVPTDAHAGTRGDRVVDHQRFVISEIAISKAGHKSFTGGAEHIGCADLWDAACASARYG